jgi:putative transposase
MPRQPRLRIAGVPQHVIVRGNNRQATFFAPRDYRFYVECLRDTAAKHECLVHAYVLMTNHVHLLITAASADGLSLLMRDLGRRYVQGYVNLVYQRSGTMWEGRYKSNLVDAQKYFLTCCRYIELNPVRARMVIRPEDYAWSSYRYHGLGVRDLLVSPHAEYIALGATALARQRAYRQLFTGSLDPHELDEIRDTVNRGWPLARESFREQLEFVLQRPARPPRRGRPAKTDLSRI